MSSKNTSKGPPTVDNPRGRNLEIAVSVVLVVMTMTVGARLWGRYRYKMPGKSTDARYGESRFWIFLSDITIVVSYTLNVSLTAICYVAVNWGEGVHTKFLSLQEIHMVLKMFYVYQVLYKFVSGISKIATLFLLLAISTQQMRAFNDCCKLLVVYIAAYCLATSLATVFQCGTSFASNWNKQLDQSKCFVLPPFWYSHAAINISATAVMIILPWWLFSSIVYKRRRIIAAVMSLLAIGETVLGCVRLYGLYTSAHSTGDMTYGTETGILVSQLEIDFACISACVPTVLRMLEELWIFLCVNVLGITSMGLVESSSQGQSGPSRSRGRGGGGGTGTSSGHIHLTDLRSVNRDPRPTGPYTSFDKDDEGASMDSQEHIIKKGNPQPSGGGIKVQTDYYVTVDSPHERSFYDNSRDEPPSKDTGFETHVVAK